MSGGEQKLGNVGDINTCINTCYSVPEPSNEKIIG